jgi:putative transposase
MTKGLVRYQKCGVFHFLTFSCYRRQPLLAEAGAYTIFERALESVRLRYGFIVAGYVLMPEHVHLLAGEPAVSFLATALQVLKQQTSRKLKKGGEVQFWQRRYYDFNVHNELKRVEKLRYMHRNPVKRGLVARPEDWPWSSFLHYATDGAPSMLCWGKSANAEKVGHPPRIRERRLPPWSAGNCSGLLRPSRAPSPIACIRRKVERRRRRCGS